MERITVPDLNNQIARVNDMIRATPGQSGSLHLYQAYGKYAVRQNSGGGSRETSALMTKRELSIFLQGMIQSLLLVSDILAD